MKRSKCCAFITVRSSDDGQMLLAACEAAAGKGPPQKKTEKSIYIENVLGYIDTALANNPREGMYAAVTITLSRDEMERRRLEAAEELLKGASQARVARKFGVSRTTASRWCRTLEGQGMERLRKRKAPGRPSRLSAGQMVEVREMFAAGPRSFGFDTDRWTTARLAQAIEARLSIRYDPDHVGRLMHRLGLRAKPAPASAIESIESPVQSMVPMSGTSIEMRM